MKLGRAKVFIRSNVLRKGTRKRRETLIPVNDFVNDVYKNPMRSITTNPFGSEVSVAESRSITVARKTRPDDIVEMFFLL